jgi:hypothetical protein
MISNWGSLGRLGPRLLATLIVLLLPTAVFAETIVIRNDHNAPIVVQASCMVGKKVIRDKPYQLNPGDSTEGIQLPGDKVITVYDAKNPNRILYQGGINGGKEDLYFAIGLVKTPKGPRMDMQRIEKPKEKEPKEKDTSK